MSKTESRASDVGEFEFFDRAPVANNMLEDVLIGLGSSPRKLPPKYFYNELGSELFQQITELPEYYPTRTERAVMEASAQQLASLIPDGACVVEYGGGSADKLRRLLRIANPTAVVPIDISRDFLLAEAKALHQDFPGLDVYPCCADFTTPVELPEPIEHLPKLAFFPGSSIGNFTPLAAEVFLGQVASAVGPGGQLLIGVDRRKDTAVLEAAYDDEAGVTARFNRNVLAHINAELGATFDLAGFRHRASYDSEDGRIDMFLVSQRDQRVVIGEHGFEFAAGDEIHTESSYKYDVDQFHALAARAGFGAVETFSDEQGWFSVYLLAAR